MPFHNSFLLLTIAAFNATADEHIWLNSDKTHLKPDTVVCESVDQRKIVGEKLRNIASALHVNIKWIQFEACNDHGFHTLPPLDEANPWTRIRFPKDALDQEGYLPPIPIAHEFGHIVQSRQFGNSGILIEKLGFRATELGADFLAGYALHRVDPNYNPTFFSSDLNVKGNYAQLEDDHGEPIQRVSAFRLGWFGRISDKMSPEEAHLDFQFRLASDSELLK